MPSATDSLLRDGLAFLMQLLPKGYSVTGSALKRPSNEDGEWIVVRDRKKQSVTCLVLARCRVESRDLGAIAATAARTRNPALLISRYLSPTVRERLRGFGIGHWDLSGNVQIGLSAIDLCIEQDGTSHAGSGEHAVRSLSGEMAGRVARALIDIKPPYTLGILAEHARVESSCASRVVAFLGEADLLLRQPRGKIEEVNWKELLRRWSLDAPLQSRGEEARLKCARGIPEFLGRLGQSGFLHALTGEHAFAKLASLEVPETATLYVDDVAAARNQFSLHPANEGANVILVKPYDRSVFQRSSEAVGLRYVSPSLMVADLGESEAVEPALTWLARHESAWRQHSIDIEIRKRRTRAEGR
jgi:hypothetical protein